MLLINNIFKYGYRSTSCHVGPILANPRNQFLRDYQERNLIGIAQRMSPSLQRCYSNQGGEPAKQPIRLPPLVDDQISLVPNFFKALRSSYYLHFVLKVRLEPEFSMNDFVEASKQAAVVVSDLLSREDYEELEDLVTAEAIQKLRHTISRLSTCQKNLIPIEKDDIYGFFPYQIDVMYEGEGENRRTFSEISEVFYILKGLKELHGKGIMPPLTMGLMPEYREKIFVCNIRLRRDYSVGTDSSWIVNRFNVFSLVGLEG